VSAKGVGCVPVRKETGCGLADRGSYAEGGASSVPHRILVGSRVGT